MFGEIIIDGEQVTEKDTHLSKKKKSKHPYSLQNNILWILLNVNRTCYIYTPNAIYKELLSSLKERFKDIALIIPSKSSVYFKIREIDLIWIRFKPFWEEEIHGENQTVMILATNESLCMMRYNTHTYIDVPIRSTHHLLRNA
ncbi:hypothetical protein HZS_4459 [Henneguya salminicola]|nr:hypothetical protein HZS_4459 [Henneguya salminicola]